MTRTFTAVSIKKLNGTLINYTDGHYVGNEPYEVVKKVFSKALTHCKENCNTFIIVIRETTRNSAKKEYKYKVTKKREHREVERDGVLITYTFTTKVKSLN